MPRPEPPSLTLPGDSPFGVEVQDLSFCRGDFSLRVPGLKVYPGEKVAVMGENGSGKSTLLALMAGLLAPISGRVTVGGVPVEGLCPAERARLMAFLPQVASVVFPFTVYQLVLMGRFSRLQGRDFDGEDHRATKKVLNMLDLESLAERRCVHLSGGEQRRAMLARVLNQNTPVLFLDEPVSMLDSRHGLMVLSLIARGPKTVVAVMHDVNLALSFFQRFIFLKNGQVAYDVKSKEVDHEMLSQVYGVSVSRGGAFSFSLP